MQWDYIDAATTGIQSLHVLPVDLPKMLIHIEEVLPSTMHLPVSSEDTLQFYRYLCTHLLIADKQFFLLINVPIQDYMQQLKIYEVFNLVIPHRNLSACCNVDSKYLGITYNETNTVEILEQQPSTWNRLTDSFAVLMHLLNQFANPTIMYHNIYTQGTKQELIKDAHYRSGTPIVPPSPH